MLDFWVVPAYPVTLQNKSYSGTEAKDKANIETTNIKIYNIKFEFFCFKLYCMLCNVHPKDCN